MTIPGVCEELLEQLTDQSGFHAIVIVFAVATVANQARHAQQCQVMAHGRLRLAEQLAQGGDVQFTVLGQSEQDFETGFIRQELENLREAVDGAWGDFD